MKIDSAEKLDGRAWGRSTSGCAGRSCTASWSRGADLAGQARAELGVSRTPCARRSHAPARGPGRRRAEQTDLVAPFSVEDMEELYALRITVEALGVRLTVPLLSEEDLATLDGRLAQMAYFAEREDYERYSVPHPEFHAGLVGKSGARIVTLLGQLSDHCERYRRLHTTQAPHAWEKGAREHRAILDACIARDADTAAVRLAEHLSHTALDNLELLDAGTSRSPCSGRSTRSGRSAGLPLRRRRVSLVEQLTAAGMPAEPSFDAGRVRGAAGGGAGADGGGRDRDPAADQRPQPLLPDRLRDDHADLLRGRGDPARGRRGPAPARGGHPLRAAHRLGARVRVLRLGAAARRRRPAGPAAARPRRRDAGGSGSRPGRSRPTPTGRWTPTPTCA